MPKSPFNPDKEIKDYCDHIMHSHIQVRRQNPKTKSWYWDYPATAVICHNHSRDIKRASFSHYPSPNEWHPILKAKLESIHRIGTHLIGNCAEQHAANKFMKQVPENNLGKLYFSEALRPRTKEVIAYCENCKNTFPNI